MKKAVLFFGVVVMAVSFFSCSKPVDFYDLRVLERNDITAYGKVYNKLSKKQKVEYTDFKKSLTDEDFFAHIVEKQELFNNFNAAMEKFFEDEIPLYEETENKVSRIQDRISDLQSSVLNTENQNSINRAFGDYDRALREYSTLRYGQRIVSYLEDEIELTQLEKDRLTFEIDRYLKEKSGIFTTERTAFREEHRKILNEARAEAEKRRQEQIAVARQKAEEIRIEKERRGGVAQSFSLNNLSTNQWVSFYLMKDGAGTFDPKFNVNNYIAADKIREARIVGVVNPVLVIDGVRYAIAKWQ